LVLPATLNKIPLSSLAAILIYTGYKLTQPRIYRTIYKQGMESSSEINEALFRKVIC